MNPEQYTNKRVDDQIAFYDTKSKSSQSMYKGLSVIQIISGAIIPLVSGFSDDINYSEWITALLGVAVTCATALLSLCKYQERWINYRTTCETLKHLKHLFLTSSTPYKDDDSFDIFVNDIESIISKENSDWGKYIAKTPDDQNKR
ncbi:MAG: DUF4231 domain-containing protein [Gammaproteobacteria bacterium]|nr:DUF4231 domain-containing protein [Gammaproteobacteria bacterium]